MKISAEAADRNLKLINRIKKGWEEGTKTPLEYFKEIEEVSKEVFAVATVPNNNMFERGTYVPGDGDTKQQFRPGSQDHLKHKSKGLLSHEHKDS
ncbi:hypothetical protein UFOVP252_38 [uncultured Caudovirales phage]|uniref:Uncharacterized protein n=1 Tax=uncultured Caudovirales phage TaxID=2100421 RepID=A0A6J5LIS4_9CAUD|nr:hypothetical protein UFOVP252_38 [uncultured Caudovirales phage]